MFVVVAGPGGVGKSTVVNRLLEILPDVRLSRSWTTRPRRGDEPRDAYVFVDRDRFMDRVAEEGFLEWTEFAGTGHLYGTPELDQTDPADEVVILEIELDGARQVKAKHPDALLILITPPSREAREARLRARGDDDASVARRMEVGEQELELGSRIADVVVRNEDVDNSARELAGIIGGRRSSH